MLCIYCYLFAKDLTSNFMRIKSIHQICHCFLPPIQYSMYTILQSVWCASLTDYHQVTDKYKDNPSPPICNDCHSIRICWDDIIRMGNTWHISPKCKPHTVIVSSHFFDFNSLVHSEVVQKHFIRFHMGTSILISVTISYLSIHNM